MRGMLRLNYTKLFSGECSSKTLDTKPEWTLLERLVYKTFETPFVISSRALTLMGCGKKNEPK